MYYLQQYLRQPASSSIIIVLTFVCINNENSESRVTNYFAKQQIMQDPKFYKALGFKRAFLK